MRFRRQVIPRRFLHVIFRNHKWIREMYFSQNDFQNISLCNWNVIFQISNSQTKNYVCNLFWMECRWIQEPFSRGRKPWSAHFGGRLRGNRTESLREVNLPPRESLRGPPKPPRGPLSWLYLHYQWARRDRLMSRGKACRETIFVSHLSRNYPHRRVNFERG